MIASGYAEGAAGATSAAAINLDFAAGGVAAPRITTDIAGTTAQNLSLVVTSFSGTSDVIGSLTWAEVR